MSALVPYNYHGRFHEKYFEAYKRFMEQKLSIPRPFSNQWSFYSNNRYPFPDQMPFSSTTTGNSLMTLSQFNQQQKYAQYIRHLNDVQMRSSNRESQRRIPPPRHTSTAWQNTSGQLYIYEKETRYLPYPVFGSSGRGGLGFTGGLTTLIAPGGGGGMDLPPKIRVIFLPTGTPSLQQPCAGALGMPPFLFNRMAQPLYTLPLPPPLPQIGSLPVTPVVQQMIMQQYSNPIAILPFNRNLQMPPAIMPAYQSMPPQQFFAPTTFSDPPQFTPQSYIPPTLLPSNMPLRPNIFPPVPYSFDAIPLPVSRANDAYPSTCRACIPPPPSLDRQVLGHQLLQHCSACRLVPADTSSPNSRPIHGRSTPLLRHPLVQDTMCCPPVQQKYHYPHINLFPTRRPSLYNIPLPPGAVLISDEYIDRNGVGDVHHSLQTKAIDNPRVFHSAPTSMALLGYKMNHIPKKKKRSRRKGHRDNKSTSNASSTVLSTSSSTTMTRSSSSSSWCSLCEAEQRKKLLPLDIISNTDQQVSIGRQKMVSKEVRKLNLPYGYQSSDLNSIHNDQQGSKISDTDSISTFNPKMLTNDSHVEENNGSTVLTPVSVDLLKSEDQKSISSLSLNQSQIKNPVKQIIIIQRRRSSSLTSIHTISSDDSLTNTNAKE